VKPETGKTAESEKAAMPAKSEDTSLMETPPALAPLSKEPVTLKMSAEARVVFRTIGKLAGVNVIFDPEFQDKKINVDLVNVTIQQAMKVASVESKSFWKPVSTNIILVMPDTPQKRKEQEEQILQKIYLEHTQTAQELTEILTSVQGMLELRHVQALPRENAILVRDTPAKVQLASRLIRDSDRGRAEVVVQISVLQVRRDKARSLGIQPTTSATVKFDPALPLGPAGSVRLNKLDKIAQDDFTVTMPNAVISALYSDSNTKIIQNPEVRVSDGEAARLRVGDRIPIATGSFQALAGTGPAVNTQFQYLDVGVNIDLTPHVHPDRSVSIKLGVEVSSVTGQVNIGGLLQPIISQRRIDHEIRLQEGEVSILGGLAERTQSKAVTGWPGLSRLPLLRYLFSGEDTNNSENEVLIVIRPRMVRMRENTPESLRAMSIGTDAEMILRQKDDVVLPVAVSAAPRQVIGQPPETAPQESQIPSGATLQLEPQKASVRAGDTFTVNVKLEDVEDLSSASLLLKFDPQALSIEDVRHGDFLSGGNAEIAILQRIDKEKGEGSIYTTRPPNSAGVSGKGVLLSILVKHLTQTTTSLEVIQVGARTSRQKAIPVTITQGTTVIQ
jgi:general secretion pathway protein D